MLIHSNLFRNWKAIARIVALAITMTSPGWAQSGTTSPQGLYKLGAYDNTGHYLGLLTNSDTLISLPFTRTPEFLGSVASVSGSTLTVAGSPAWSANQFVYVSGTQPKTYFVLIGAGPSGTTNPKEGAIYTVTANTSNSLTLTLNGDDISSIPANSQITVIPYWTLATVFPPSDSNVSFTPTTSTRLFKTEILIPNYAGVGVNVAYSNTYYFINTAGNVGWRLFNDSGTKDHGDDILLPDGYFVVHNLNAAPTLPLALYGTALTGKVVTPQTTQAAIAQDNPTSMIRPIDVSLNNTGLSPANGSFVATTTTRQLRDELLVFDNSKTSYNKSPSATYYYFNNAWRLFNDAGTVDHGADIIPAGSALIIRKAASTTGQTAFWTNTATYSN